MHVLHYQSLETHTTHFHATFYRDFIFYMFVFVNDMQEKTYKKDCLHVSLAKHYEVKATRLEFIEIVRK